MSTRPASLIPLIPAKAGTQRSCTQFTVISERDLEERNLHALLSDGDAIGEVPGLAMAEKLKTRIDIDQRSVRETIFRIYEGFDRRAELRRPSADEQPSPEQMKSALAPGRREDPTPPRIRRQDRQRRMSIIRERAKSDEEAVALAVGWEAWAAGVQMLVATVAD